MSIGGLFASNETNSVTEILNKTLNDMTTRLSKQDTSFSRTETATVQELNPIIEIKTNRCPININQSTVVQSNIYKNFISENQQEIEKELKNTLDTFMSDSIEQETQTFGVGSNEANVYKNNVNDTINDLSTRITQTLDSSFEAKLKASQQFAPIIRIDDNYCDEQSRGGIVTVTQNIDLNQLVDETLKSESVLKEISKLDNLVKTTAETEV